jgi:hypothetical protein
MLSKESSVILYNTIIKHANEGIYHPINWMVEMVCLLCLADYLFTICRWYF